MLKVLGIFIFCTWRVISADDRYIKNCTQIPFCAKFRNLNLDDDSKFSADLFKITESDNVVNIPLLNSKGDNLVLQLSILADSMVRIEIGEPNNTRFRLLEGWALQKTPDLVKPHIDHINKSLVLVYGDSMGYYVNITRGPPFQVQVGINREHAIVLSGDKLIMENTNDSQAYAFQVEFEDAEKLYGLFDHSYRLALGETADGSTEPFRLKNVDSSLKRYSADSTSPLYGAVPAIYGHSSSLTSGVFLHNGADQWIDISYSGERPNALFMVESAALDLFVLLGPYPSNVVRQFTELTGKFALPQLWTLGYHQCRKSYQSQEEVKNVTATMQAYEFPMDAIWLARDHTDANRWFRWNESTFSDPVEMMENISAINKKCVTISDPHFKVDEHYVVYTEAKKNEYFVKSPNGDDFEGKCWPGLSSWIDYFMPSAASFYASWYHYDKWNYTTPVLAGIWNDMNEPAVFGGPETTAPNNLVHRVDDEGTEVLHRDVHNLYGLMHVKGTFQGLLERDNFTKRPFILTRSHFAGSQRYAAVWTGDNSDTWQYFANSFSQCMTANLLGMPMCGADVAAYFGNTPHELAQRWYQGGAWLPFFRAHSDNRAPRREPYLYPEEVRNVIRKAIELRYRHIPYFYTLFFEHSLYGSPIVSPLFYYYPGVHDNDTQMLVGKNIMPVVVVNGSVTEVEVYFPGDDIWYRVDTSVVQLYSSYGGNTASVAVDINSLPVFYRGGGIIPTRSEVKLSTGDYTDDDPYTLVVCLDENNTAEGFFYMDDFSSFAYQDNSYYYLHIVAQDISGLSVTVNFVSGNPDGFSPVFNYVEVFEMINTDKGKKAVQTRHSKTKDGILLRNIDFGAEIKKSGNENFVFQL